MFSFSTFFSVFFSFSSFIFVAPFSPQGREDSGERADFSTKSLEIHIKNIKFSSIEFLVFE